MQPQQCAKIRNPCKFCLQSVNDKNGLKCMGACKKWAHFKCLNYTPGKISDIKAGIIKVTCPCPDCNTSQPKEFVTNPPYSCSNQECPANEGPKCESFDCPSNRKNLMSFPIPPSPQYIDSSSSCPNSPRSPRSPASYDKSPSPGDRRCPPQNPPTCFTPRSQPPQNPRTCFTPRSETPPTPPTPQTPPSPPRSGNSRCCPPCSPHCPLKPISYPPPSQKCPPPPAKCPPPPPKCPQPPTKCPPPPPKCPPPNPKCPPPPPKCPPPPPKCPPQPPKCPPPRSKGPPQPPKCSPSPPLPHECPASPQKCPAKPPESRACPPTSSPNRQCPPNPKPPRSSPVKPCCFPACPPTPPRVCPNSASRRPHTTTNVGTPVAKSPSCSDISSDVPDIPSSIAESSSVMLVTADSEYSMDPYFEDSPQENMPSQTVSENHIPKGWDDTNFKAPTFGYQYSQTFLTTSATQIPHNSEESVIAALQEMCKAVNQLRSRVKTLIKGVEMR